MGLMLRAMGLGVLAVGLAVLLWGCYGSKHIAMAPLWVWGCLLWV